MWGRCRYRCGESELVLHLMIFLFLLAILVGGFIVLDVLTGAGASCDPSDVC